MKLIIYYKTDCELCEQMESELQEFLSTAFVGSLEIVKRDIEDNENWFNKYKELIPVLMLDEVEVSHYFFDPEVLTVAIENNLRENSTHAAT